MNLYEKLKTEHKANLLEEKRKYPTATRRIIKTLKNKYRYRDLTIEEAYDLRVFTNGSEHKVNVWADDLFETKTIE